MEENIKISLVRKYLSVGSVGLLGIVLLFTIINTKYQNNNLRDLHLQQAKELLKVLEFSSAEDIYSNKVERLKQTLDFLRSEVAVISIDLIDTEGNIIAAGVNKNKTDQSLLSDPVMQQALQNGGIEWEQKNNSLHLCMPIDLPNIRLGGINMVYSLEELKETELSVLFNNLKFGVIIFIIGFTLMLFFIKKIVAPVKQLIEGTREVAAGNYNLNIEIETRDEFEFLAYSFNDMVEQVKHTRDEIVEAREKAEASDRMKTEFLAQISHEIRTPINAIVNFTELLKTEFEHKLYGETKEAFDIIQQSSDRLIRTIDLILNMSELQTGSYNPAFEKINLYEEIITPIIKQLRGEANLKNVLLTSENNSDKTVLVGDKYSLQQLFSNLVDNAIKYTDKGEVKVVIDKYEDDKLVVHVKDTGIGIADEFMPFLFEPFMQEDHGYTRKYEGTGLGLALVKKYCEINNAEIKVDTKKDIGTTFTVTFELEDD
jgi:signal transduction histidine kinase